MVVVSDKERQPILNGRAVFGDIRIHASNVKSESNT